MRFLGSLSLTAAGLLLSGCGGGGSGPGVAPVPATDFRFLAPATATLVAGQGADLAVSVERLNGFSATLSVTVSGLPAGVTAQPLSLDATASAGTLRLAATPSAPAGTSALTFSASGGGLTRSSACTLTVQAAPAPSFDFAPSTGTASVVAGGSTAVAVGLERVHGHALPVTFSVEGAGSGLTASFSPATTATSQTTLSLAASAGTPAGSRALTLRATDGSLVRSQGLVVSIQATPAPALAAFPGAEGWGAAATGGRGGQVLYVTTLAPDPAGALSGSLQWACNQPGPRYILFKVSGLIDGDIQLTRPDVTIAGHTSPGGIIVRQFHTTEDPYCDGNPDCLNNPATRRASNWILRHLRMRPAGGGQDDALRILSTHTAIVDHCSMANAIDECVQLSASRDITIQDSLLAETLGEHANLGGMLVNYSVPAAGLALDRLSILRNGWIRLLGRLPELSRESPAAAGSLLNLELSNNLLWDPGFYIDVNPTTISGGEGSPVYFALNWVGNFAFLRGGHPYGMMSFPVNTPVGETATFFSDNRMSLYSGRGDYQLLYCCNDYPDTVANPGSLPYPNPAQPPPFARTLRHAFPPLGYLPSATVREQVRTGSGAFPRDPMDRRLLGPLASGIVDPAPRDQNPYADALLFDWTTAPAAPADTDADGMPDAWEVANGLNPAVADHAGKQLSLPKLGVTGYDNLEVYLHELHRVRTGQLVAYW